MLKKRPWFLFVFGSRWFTFYPNIYVPPKQWPVADAMRPMRVHETVHLVRQTEHRWRWLFKYVWSRSFRLAEEAVAIAAELKELPEASRPYRLDCYAKWLSGWDYFWAAKSPEAAREAIHKAST